MKKDGHVSSKHSGLTIVTEGEWEVILCSISDTYYIRHLPCQNAGELRPSEVRSGYCRECELFSDGTFPVPERVIEIYKLVSMGGRR
jgi:hypothetical protein